MLLVKTKIGLSKIHGIGLFADQFIPRGTPIWKFMPDFDLEIDENQLAKFPEIAKEYFLKYSYLDLKTKKHILCSDDARFSNHSENPNITSDKKEEIDIAGRDISKGEELTYDYKEFCYDFDVK